MSHASRSWFLSYYHWAEQYLPRPAQSLLQMESFCPITQKYIRVCLDLPHNFAYSWASQLYSSSTRTSKHIHSASRSFGSSLQNIIALMFTLFSSSLEPHSTLLANVHLRLYHNRRRLRRPLRLQIPLRSREIHPPPRSPPPRRRPRLHTDLPRRPHPRLRRFLPRRPTTLDVRRRNIRYEFHRPQHLQLPRS
jgi:hypothetical protein